jgi:hypothetical protein
VRSRFRDGRLWRNCRDPRIPKARRFWPGARWCRRGGFWPCRAGCGSVPDAASGRGDCGSSVRATDARHDSCFQDRIFMPPSRRLLERNTLPKPPSNERKATHSGCHESWRNKPGFSRVRCHEILRTPRHSRSYHRTPCASAWGACASACGSCTSACGSSGPGQSFQGDDFRYGWSVLAISTCQTKKDECSQRSIFLMRF